MLPANLQMGTLEGHFRCRWRVSRSGNTVTIVAKHRPSKKRRSRMTAVGRMNQRWETTRPAMIPKPIVPPKARMVTFFKNGDPFYSGTRVSILPGKDFLSLDGLCDYLTERTGIAQGVRYIFTLTGRRVMDIDDLQDGHSYVVSGNKNFQEIAYGLGNRHRPARTGKRQVASTVRKDDLKLFRPVSPIDQRSGRDWRIRTPKNLRSRSLPTQHEGRTITVVNSQNPTVFSRVLLNLRTTQTFEEIVGDLGQAIKLKQAKRIYNQQGDEVRSFSQLKHELRKGETFYLDADETLTVGDRNEEGYFSMEVNEGDLHAKRQSALVQSGSLPNLTDNRIEEGANEKGDESKLQVPTSDSSPGSQRRQSSTQKSSDSMKSHTSRDRKRTAAVKDRRDIRNQESIQQKSVPNSSVPNKRLEIAWVHGYHGLDPGRNLYILSSGELAYYVGTMAILHHHLNLKQRHYLGHTEDIQCMTLHTHDDILATGQGAGPDGKSQTHIRIWRADDMTTLAVVGQGRLENPVVGIAFSWEGVFLLVLENYQNTSFSVWDWQRDIEISRATTEEEILGGTFHPLEDDLIITYGKQHLAFWLKEDNGQLERQDPITAGRNTTTFLCIEFLSDGSLVTGNSKGFVTIWAPSEDSKKVLFIKKEFKAHESEVTALLTLPEGVLLSGSSTPDQEGHIRVWDTNKKFAKVAMATLPTGSGGVTSLCPQRMITNEWEIYVGTNKNVILEGSVLWTLNPVVHGHYDEVRALACHPDKPIFVTAGLDRYICRWEVNSLIWKVQSDSECLSVTIHPHGSIVAVGDEHGDVTFLNMEDGLHVTTLPVTNNSLYTLKYSPDGDTLAVGCADGNIYLFQSHSNGYMYKIDTVLQGTVPILMLDWSVDGKNIQAVFTDNDYHDIVFWNIKKKEKIQTASQVKEIEWYKPNSTLGYKINGMWNNKHLPDAVHVCCHTSNSKQLLAAGDKNGFVRLFRYPCTSERAAYLEEKQCSTDVNVIQFLSDDKHLVTTGGPDGAVFVWKLSLAQNIHR